MDISNKLRSWFVLTLKNQISNLKNKQNSCKDETLLCALSFDEIAICPKVEYRNRCMYDGVEKLNSKQNMFADEALFFMAVPLQSSDKIPLGYSLVSKKFTAEEKASLLKLYLRELHEIGVQVTSVTCDGVAKNLKAFQIFSASLKINKEFKPHFEFEGREIWLVFLLMTQCWSSCFFANCRSCTPTNTPAFALVV